MAQDNKIPPAKSIARREKHFKMAAKMADIVAHWSFGNSVALIYSEACLCYRSGITWEEYVGKKFFITASFLTLFKGVACCASFDWIQCEFDQTRSF